MVSMRKDVVIPRSRLAYPPEFRREAVQSPVWPEYQGRVRVTGDDPSEPTQTGRGLLRVGDRDRVTVYRMSGVEKASGFPVSVACELLGVSRSGFHDWQTRSPSDRELADVWLTEKIRETQVAKRGVYGARRIHVELRVAANGRLDPARGTAAL